MKRQVYLNQSSRKLFLLIAVFWLSATSVVLAQTTTFTYQGRLTDGGTPANGIYDLQFVLATVKNDIGADLDTQKPALILQFNQGGRGQVIYRLADDDAGGNPINNRAFVDAEYNRAFVFTQYAGYLRRDADMGGFLFWLGQVNSGPLRDSGKQHAMVCSFMTSGEYQLRFGGVVTHGNDECQ